MNSLKIKNKLILLSIAVIAVIFAFSIYNSYNLYQKYTKTSKTEKIIDLALKFSSVLHALQIERGVSAVYIVSNGKLFLDKVEESIHQTNLKIKDLKNSYSNNKHLLMDVLDADISFDNLFNEREIILQRKVNNSNVISYYSLLNKKIINAIAQFSVLAKDDTLGNQFSSIVILISAKEKAGIERTLLASAFFNNEFSKDNYELFTKLFVKQETLMNIFYNTASLTNKYQYEKMEKNQIFIDVNKIRNIALSKKENFNIDAIQWFDVATKRINLLKEYEDNISNKIRIASISNAKNSLFYFFINTIVSIIIIFFILRISKTTIKTISISYNSLEISMDILNANIIYTKSDLNNIITDVSDAFCDISGYSKKEMIGKSHDIIRHEDMDPNIIKSMWETLINQETWYGELKNKKKDGGYYWVSVIIEHDYDINNNHVGYSAIKYDITSKKEVEDLSHNLEEEVKRQTKSLAEQKESVETLIDSQEQIIITTDGIQLLSSNKSFLNFFQISKQEDFTKDYACICDKFSTTAPKGYLQIEVNGKKWINHILDNPYTVHKAMINMNNENHIFSVTAAKLPGKNNLKSAVFSNITEIEYAKEKLEDANKHTKESILYASQIQNALIPHDETIDHFFKEHITIWQPKDIVGGDIYLFEQLRHEDECLLMVLDCTGHGVAGAFLTMLVKAVERQIVSHINNDLNEVVSPAHIMKIMNKNMKQLLKQEDSSSKSNVGLDGAIIYYNKKEQVLKYSGAKVPLYYIDEHNDLQVIKPNKYSVGYKNCKTNYEYKEHSIQVKEGMKFYCTTDGYLDQNGGNKGFPFGNKRFRKLLTNNKVKTMQEQKEVFLSTLENYKNEDNHNQQNIVTDDITLIAFEIKQSDSKETILEYEGVLTQGIIAHSMDIIEQNIENLGTMGYISTAVIELTQNMMKYSKARGEDSTLLKPAGLINVQQDAFGNYIIRSKNIISLEDKERIESRLIDIDNLDKAGIRKKYKELRRSGENAHELGGGIGFYEIAKISSNIDYSFKIINKTKCFYMFKLVLEKKLP